MDVSFIILPESSCWASCTTVLPVIVMVSNVKMAKVYFPQDVGVPYEGDFPVVVEVVVRDSDPIAGTDDIELAILSHISPRQSIFMIGSLT